MEKEIKLKLGTNSIHKIIDDMRTLSNQLKNINNVVCAELAEQTKNQLQQNYSALPFKGNEKVTISITKESDTYKISAIGKNVVYEEFGTGDVGLSSPHPISQSHFGLKGYNTGKTIKPADEQSAAHGISSGNYWKYWSDLEHKWIYTQGIPSGKFMFNTSEWLRNNRKDIIKKKVDDVISKV